jgi:calmodulin
MNEIDSESKGEVQFDQFTAYMSKTLPSSDSKEELRRAFQVFDTNNFGFINLYELRSVLQNLGEKMSDSEFLEMVKGSNLVRDGRVYYDGKNV